MAITFVGLCINFPTEAIFMTFSAFLFVSDVKLKFGGASVRLYHSTCYLIATLPVRRLAYRHRIEFHFIQIDLFSFISILPDHVEGIVFPDHEELPIRKLTYLHFVSKFELHPKNISQRHKSIDPIHRLIVLVCPFDITVTEDGS